MSNILSGLQILVVDDEKDICNILAETFENYGAKAYSAYNGVEGLDILSKIESINLVLTDIRMPKMGGKEMIETIRQKENQIPIICMSGFSIYEQENVLDWGANAFISKPTDMESLLSIMSELTNSQNK